MNVEFLVKMNHYFILITSLPFVHTTRRFNRLNDPANSMDVINGLLSCCPENGASLVI